MFTANFTQPTHTRERVPRAAFYCHRNLLPKLYLTRVYRINTARVSAALVEAHAGCLCCVPMRLHVSIHRYLCMYAVLSTDQSKKEREHGRTHKLPVHSSGLSINAPMFTANIIEQQQQRGLSCSPTQEGSGRRAGVADPAAYAQIVGS